MEPIDVLQRLASLLDQAQRLVQHCQAVPACQPLQQPLEQLLGDLKAHDQQFRTLIGQLRPRGQDVKPLSAFLEPAGTPFPWELPETEESSTSDRPDRRAAGRRGGNLVAVFLACAAKPDHVITAWVLDRSLGGLGLLADAAVSIGDVLSVRLASAVPEDPGLPIEVRHAQQFGSSWRVGCRFLDQASWEQVERFG
jgi:hypothetical protein